MQSPHLLLFSILGLLLGLFFPISLEVVVKRGGSAIGSVGVFEGLFGTGFIMGPMLGGLLASYEERLPYIAMGLITLAPIFTLTFKKEIA